MKLYLRGHDCRYTAEQMVMTLFPGFCEHGMMARSTGA